IDPFVSHMFVFYFGILANLTPPIALAAFAGAGIAGGEPNRTGFASLKLAAAGILVPYVFAYSPELLMQNATSGEIIWATVTATIGIITLGAALEGYLLTNVNIYLRGIALACALTLVIPGVVSDAIGLSLLAVLIVFQVIQRRQTHVQLADGA